MLDHISLGVRDLERAAVFYDAVLSPLGATRVWSHATGVGYGTDGVNDRLAIKVRAQARPYGEGTHVAFTATSRAAVDAFYAAAIRLGATSDGQPGDRPLYGAHYYAAFVIDPDGHRIEAVCHLENGP